MTSRFGFACKFMPEATMITKDQQEWLSRYNLRGTTATYLLRQSHSQAVGKVLDIVKNNVQVLVNQLQLMSTWPVSRRMLRIGSHIFPCYTHEKLRHLYCEPVITKAMEKLSVAGDIARKNDIRLSMHPGQFTMLCSKTEETIDRSIEDIEYHAQVLRLMGYNGSDQRQEINIHGGARCANFQEQFRRNFKRLANDTQQWLSVENDEVSYCLDDLLPLHDIVKICLDINHYWINQGSYIGYHDPRLLAVIESWRGARPEMHVAFPHEEVILDHPVDVLPDMQELLNANIKKQDLRAHSFGVWNTALAKYVIGFAREFDLMFEGKSKNLAAKNLYETFVKATPV